jgi:hypothetical protein
VGGGGTQLQRDSASERGIGEAYPRAPGHPAESNAGREVALQALVAEVVGACTLPRSVMPTGSEAGGSSVADRSQRMADGVMVQELSGSSDPLSVRMKASQLTQPGLALLAWRRDVRPAADGARIIFYCVHLFQSKSITLMEFRVCSLVLLSPTQITHPLIPSDLFDLHLTILRL